MGFSFKKQVKKLKKSVKKAVKAPLRATQALIKGDAKGAFNQTVQGSVASFNAANLGANQQGALGDSLLKSKTFNDYTFNTGKEILQHNRGMQQLEAEGETGRRFYQASAALGAKVAAAAAVVAYAPAGSLTAKNAYTAVKAGAALKAGDYAAAAKQGSQIEGVEMETPEALDESSSYYQNLKDAKETAKKYGGYLKKSPTQSASLAQQPTQDDSTLASDPTEPKKENSMLPIIVGAGLALSGVGLPIALAGTAATLFMKGKK